MSKLENNILKIKLLNLDLTPYLQRVEDVLFTGHSLTMYVLRLDKLDLEISGNKWFKLKYNLEEVEKQGYKTMLTFGGAYSNHIAATAAAGRLTGLKTIGVIRGEEKKNNTLEKATADGMELYFINREEYRQKTEAQFIEQLHKKFGNFYLIPEGGANNLGVKGCSEIVKNSSLDFDHVCCACGTGTTLAGIVLGLKNDQHALGFSALKGGEFLEGEVKKFIGEKSLRYNIITDYHFGGYAKTNPELSFFIKKMELQHEIPLDPIYTGKMMFGIYDLVRKNYFQKNKTLLVIHSGGLQGKI